MNIGVIGCGAMGKGMVKNLIKHGLIVKVYDVSPDYVSFCHEMGAIPVSSARETASDADALFLSLPSPEVVENVLLGEEGILNVLKTGAYILDLSTIDPMTSIRLSEQANHQGVNFFDCPVSGGPAGADQGNLTIMVGGPEGYFSSVLPLLQVIGKEIIYLGKSGAGQTAKLCHNMLVASITASLGEVLTVGAKAGISPKSLANVIEKGSANNRVLSIFGPNMIEGTYDNVNFFLSHMHKDVTLYTKLAADQSLPSFIGSLVLQLYESAKAKGMGKLDSSAVCLTIQEQSNFSFGTAAHQS